MRVFVGIGLPLRVAERLVRAAYTLLPPEASHSSRIRWTKPNNIHVTLRFLGHVEPERLEGIQRSLAALGAPRLQLELSGIGVFAGVLHTRVKPSAALLAFAERVFRSVESCGFPPEQRPFVPHVTLARAKGRFSLLPLREADPAFWQAFEAGEFRLYESFTKPEGTYYEVLQAFPLG